MTYSTNCLFTLLEKNKEEEGSQKRKNNCLAYLLGNWGVYRYIFRHNELLECKFHLNLKFLTSIFSAETSHHLWWSFDESESWAPPAAHRHHAHPLQGRGEGKPLDNGHRLTCGLTRKEKRRVKVIHKWKLKTAMNFFLWLRIILENKQTKQTHTAESTLLNCTYFYFSDYIHFLESLSTENGQETVALNHNVMPHVKI